MTTEYTILIEKDEEGYYVGAIPALPGCHSQARSVAQLMERMEEAIALWLVLTLLCGSEHDNIRLKEY